MHDVYNFNILCVSLGVNLCNVVDIKVHGIHNHYNFSEMTITKLLSLLNTTSFGNVDNEHDTQQK